MNENPYAEPGPVVKLFGAMLMAVGGLIAVLSGLCSLAFLGPVIVNVIQQPNLNAQSAMVALPWVLIVGGIPIGVGVGIFVIGRHLFRGRRVSA